MNSISNKNFNVSEYHYDKKEILYKEKEKRANEINLNIQ
jgi:hypothetical protein